MNCRRNKKPFSPSLPLPPSLFCFFSLSWLSKLKKKINGSSNFKKNQESDQTLNSEAPKAFQKETDPNWQKRKECKMKATKIEDMKKVESEERERECKRGFDRFAVVRSSVEPQKDFRDSMVEMITQNGIRRSEELEELLACYLSLNHDEYHDLIVQVFRDVWFELLEVRESRITI